MEMKRGVKGEENMCTALLTAGVVLSMACLKHFSAVSSLIEQWRAWVFIVLNLVLLAIYFTSTRPAEYSHENQDFKIHHAARLKIRRRKTTKRVCSEFVGPENAEEIKDCRVKENNGEKKKKSTEKEKYQRACEFGKKMGNDEKEGESRTTDDKKKLEDENYYEPCRLSNEELNERVEAFIAMFRQHLVLDAQRGRDRDRREVVSRRSEADMAVNSPDKGCYHSNNIDILAQELTCSV